MVQTRDQFVSTDAERYLLVYMIAVLIIITTLIIVFFVVFTKRKNKLIFDKIKQQQEFEEELAKTQLEIQEQTLKNIGRELHDNVGQMLAYSNMQLNALGATVSDAIKPKVEDIKKVISDSIQEVRALSKTLNSDVVLNVGLKLSLKNEVERLNKLNSLKASLIIDGEEVELPNKKDEIFIYRIVQEFISNTLKYSEAETIKIQLNYLQKKLTIIAKDDGAGFNENEIKKGSGLINMQNRAALINAKCTLESQPNQGVTLTLEYPYQT
jgi:signal transduction histidine kinase